MAAGLAQNKQRDGPVDGAALVLADADAHKAAEDKALEERHVHEALHLEAREADRLQVGQRLHVLHHVSAVNSRGKNVKRA